jgi:hypothetical protein
MLGPYSMSRTGVERSGGGYFRIPPAVGFSSSKNLPRRTVRMRGSRGRAGSHGGEQQRRLPEACVSGGTNLSQWILIGKGEKDGSCEEAPLL